ncbi:class I SAM-dependent methyltransferase [Candidatus Woesearchaeota archaeon]|nr:class I SAM-dependent methyltransferase [Candidatus Woesearchaeota archaeon]
MLSKEQEKQEREYEFPYHHLLKRKTARGIEYFSYLDIVITLLKKYNSKNILDLGCGDGRGTKELSHFFKRVEGVDYSERAISFAKAFSPNINFKVIDFSKEINEYNLNFDSVVCIEVIEHIKSDILKMFIRNISKVLKKKGIVIITTPTFKMRLPKKHYQHFNEEKLESLFGKEFHKNEVVYHSNKYFYFLFFVFRGLLTNRFYDFNISFINYLLFKFYKLFVEKASKSNGQRIICVFERS